MRVLVACEFSGVVRDAFLAAGHDAYSCDLLPSNPPSVRHRQIDALVMAHYFKWDLMIAHPPCTYLVTSAAWAFTDGPYHQKIKADTLVGAARREAREKSLAFVCDLMNAPIRHIAIENPIGAIGTRIRKADQIIHPHQFGHDASKATCLWLKNLPPLTATQQIQPRIVNGKPRWANQTDSGQNRLSPSDDRWRRRSETYRGIADAMATQWGAYINNSAFEHQSDWFLGGSCYDR